MNWHDLLFAHWPVSAEALRPHVPARLSIDTRHGQAWLGVIPFHMSGVRLRGLAGMPGTSRFVELNLRTYVSDGEDRGVWFFSLDASSPLCVAAARLVYRLNYRRAQMTLSRDKEPGELWVSSVTRRDGSRFEASYRPTGPATVPPADSLSDWLTNRYVMFSARRGRVWKTPIAHKPWSLAPTEAQIEVNTIASGRPLGLALDEPTTPAHLVYAGRLEVRAGWPRRVY